MCVKVCVVLPYVRLGVEVYTIHLQLTMTTNSITLHQEVVVEEWEWPEGALDEEWEDETADEEEIILGWEREAWERDAERRVEEVNRPRTPSENQELKSKLGFLISDFDLLWPDGNLDSDLIDRVVKARGWMGK